MKFLLFAFLIIAGHLRANVVSGNAQLTGQTNHAGIKIKFLANSATAITDSCLSDAVGNYSLIVAGGLYQVVLSKLGFQTVFYGGNNIVSIGSATTLATETLVTGTTVILNGNVSGLLSGSNTYLVNGNLTVPANLILSVLPGATIKFLGNYSITVLGTILANGTVASPILFTSYKTGTTTNEWQGIYLYSLTNSIFNLCTIERGFNGIWIDKANATISNSTIRNFYGTGIVSNISSPDINKNTIYDFESQDYSFGITSYLGAPLIECNTIYNGRGRGISSQSAGSVKNNTIHHISNPVRGFGIDCSGFCTATVTNNLIYQCVAGIRVGESVQTAVTPVISNNSIYQNETGIVIPTFYCSPIITNNIIVNNLVGLYQNNCSTCANTPSVLSYNDVWNNTNGNYLGIPIANVGQTIATNSNGTPVDPYFNMSIDPLFINNLPPQLNSNSPCNNAGNPTYRNHIGTDLSQICSFKTETITGIAVISESNGLKVYPNPFTSELSIKSDLRGPLQLSICDLTGKIIFSELIEIDNANSILELTKLSAGMYTLLLQNENGLKQSCKLVKQ